ncbi:MAG: 23S rRNA (pseudouridine(1915)-N(3))-methyltransferase RlmH [Robiginitomaculum sp.]
MKITIRAASLIKSGPERELINDYIQRAKIIGRNMSVTDINEHSLDTRNLKTKTDITKALVRGLSPSNITIVLDERGKARTSRQIASKIGQWRDGGEPHITFLIGGAEGFDKNALPANCHKWCLGAQTWPHKLTRVMIAEQIYRSLSILAKTPYHKD